MSEDRFASGALRDDLPRNGLSRVATAGGPARDLDGCHVPREQRGQQAQAQRSDHASRLVRRHAAVDNAGCQVTIDRLCRGVPPVARTAPRCVGERDDLDTGAAPGSTYPVETTRVLPIRPRPLDCDVTPPRERLADASTYGSRAPIRELNLVGLSKVSPFSSEGKRDAVA